MVRRASACCRAARFCYSGAHGGQIALPQSLAQELVRQWTGVNLSLSNMPFEAPTLQLKLPQEPRYSEQPPQLSASEYSVSDSADVTNRQLQQRGPQAVYEGTGRPEKPAKFTNDPAHGSQPSCVNSDKQQKSEGWRDQSGRGPRQYSLAHDESADVAAENLCTSAASSREAGCTTTTVIQVHTPEKAQRQQQPHQMIRASATRAHEDHRTSMQQHDSRSRSMHAEANSRTWTADGPMRLSMPVSVTPATLELILSMNYFAVHAAAGLAMHVTQYIKYISFAVTDFVHKRNRGPCRYMKTAVQTTTNIFLLDNCLWLA